MKILSHDLEVLRHHTKLPLIPSAAKIVVMLCGLPASGKSTLATSLCQQLGLVHLESDFLRRKLFAKPTHTAEESVRLFIALYERAQELLEQGYSLLFDSTNLIESHRQITYEMAYKTEAKLFIFHLICPVSEAKRRLRSRVIREGQNANADWQVYQKLAKQVEPIVPRHYVLDTSSAGVLERVLQIIIKETDHDH